MAEKIYMLDGDTGKKLDEFVTDGIVESQPVVTQKSIFVVSDSQLHSIRRQDGKIRWKREVGTVVSKPAIYDNLVYTGAKKGLYAFNKFSGDVEWFYEADFKKGKLVNGRIYGSIVATPIVTEDRVYAGSIDAKFYAFDHNGNKKWSFSVSSSIENAVTVVDNWIYVPADKLYALKIR